MSEDVIRNEVRGNVAIITLNRPAKRNALSQQLFIDLKNAFETLPAEVRAVIFTGEGKHFCAGLDLSEHREKGPFESTLYSRWGHQIANAIRFCGRPVISAVQGAVIGGGFELTSATHIRVADETAFYQLPEGRRGIFIGGGGTVFISRIIGPDRLTEMMLTGRKFDAQDGYRLGMSHYLVPEGQSLEKALELAEQVSGNADVSNYLMLNAIEHISQMPAATGLFTEAVAQGLVMATKDATTGIDEFLVRKQDFNFKKS